MRGSFVMVVYSALVLLSCGCMILDVCLCHAVIAPVVANELAYAFLLMVGLMMTSLSLVVLGQCGSEYLAIVTKKPLHRQCKRLNWIICANCWSCI